MKVIVAGFSKTGTKSTNLALRELGYNVHDFLEYFWYFGNDWNRILTKGGSVDDFKKMYEDVDAVMDIPVYFFWKEIHQAFPDAKILLTIRDEDSWFKSYQNQMDEGARNKILHTLMILTPLGRKLANFFHNTFKVVLSVIGFKPSVINNLIPVNEMISRRLYRQHNADVIQNAPKDKLLVYKVKDCWAPLCKFLGKPVPDKPFPHENIGGKVWDKLLQEHPVMGRMMKELFVTFSLLVGLGAYGTYKIYQNWSFITFSNLLEFLKM
ncbi:uncharacterized protein LOC143462674 [Clavelina lepadiformis]|uniref:uncharacterized protein LOC143462674 n=1 Tax=Clavelina lepadiformis TaxID=159417 RepID=UPI004041BF00